MISVESKNMSGQKEINRGWENKIFINTFYSSTKLYACCPQSKPSVSFRNFHTLVPYIALFFCATILSIPQVRLKLCRL
jgi:hypothetical protein